MCLRASFHLTQGIVISIDVIHGLLKLDLDVRCFNELYDVACGETLFPYLLSFPLKNSLVFSTVHMFETVPCSTRYPIDQMMKLQRDCH